MHISGSLPIGKMDCSQLFLHDAESVTPWHFLGKWHLVLISRTNGTPIIHQYQWLPWLTAWLGLHWNTVCLFRLEWRYGFSSRPSMIQIFQHITSWTCCLWICQCLQACLSVCKNQFLDQCLNWEAIRWALLVLLFLCGFSTPAPTLDTHEVPCDRLNCVSTSSNSEWKY